MPFKILVFIGYLLILLFLWLRFPIILWSRGFSLPPWTQKAIAHRGLFDNHSTPENSLKAFENARNHGHPLELDVMLSKDQEVMVFHDENLLRMTGVSGELAAWNARDLKELKLLKTDQRIPLLSEVLGIIDGQVPIHIEIKQEGPVGTLEERVLELLKSYGGPVCILSFNGGTLAWFKAHGPQYLRVLNVPHPIFAKDLLRDIQKSRPHMINFDIESLSPFWAGFFNFFIPLGAYTLRHRALFNQFKDCLNHVIFEDFNGEWIDKTSRRG